MKLQFFKLAEKLAEKSDHPSSKHGAVLVRKNRIVGVGFNTTKTHSRSPHPFRSIHAELSAILNSQLENFKDCELYIVRKRKDNSFGNSKPCKYCLNMIKSILVEKIHYSTDAYFQTEEL